MVAPLRVQGTCDPGCMNGIGNHDWLVCGSMSGTLVVTLSLSHVLYLAFLLDLEAPTVFISALVASVFTLKFLTMLSPTRWSPRSWIK